MSPVLPHDVWLNIAGFLPTLTLRALYSVNASLLHIALDARYRQVSFIYWDDRVLRNLIRLSDPYVAGFVKILYIYPGFLKEVMDREAPNRSNEKEKEREKPSFHDRLADITHHLQDKVLALSRYQTERSGAEETKLHKLPPKASMRKLRERLKTAQDVMHAVIDLLRSLPSLTDYYITWYGLPTTSLSLTNLAVPCLGAPLVSPSLSKLSLDISLENLESLCSASFRVSRLEHLHLHLHSDHTLSPDSLTHMLNARLARSISSLAPYLRSLSIEAHEPIDIGPLLAGLDLLGKLDTLALALPLQKPHLGNPKALGRFLRSQAHTIKVLRLRVTQHDSASTGPGSHWRSIGPADPWSLNSWVRTAFGTEAGGDFQEGFDEHGVAEPLGEYEMNALESLEISSNLLPLETALYCAERFGLKVQTLSLLGSTKSFEFVKELIKVLSGEKKSGSLTEEDEGASKPESPNVNTNLRTLRLGPAALSPQLIDLFAHNLSNLRHLRLIVKYFLPSQDAVPIYGSSRMRGDGDGVQLEEQVYEFLETMQNDWSWPWWGLKTISVYSDSSTLSSPLSPPLLTRQPALSPQETTPTMPLPVAPFRTRSSKISSLPPSFTSSTTTITGKKDHAAASTLSGLELPKISVSAPITRYPTPSASTPPHPSALLDLPSSYSTSALPLPTSLKTEPITLNEEPSSPSSLAPAPTLSSISTPSSPIGASYDSSPISYVSLPSASTSALPGPSSYAYMRGDDDDGDGVSRRHATSHEGHGMRPSTIGKSPPRSQFATTTTSSSPLSSTITTTSGSAISSSSSPSTPTRGSHHHMFGFLRSRKEKGAREKKNMNVNVDNTTLTSATSHTHLAPLPIRNSSNGSGGSGGERRKKMRPLVVMTGHSTHSQDVSERMVKDSNCQSKMGKSGGGGGASTTVVGDKEKASSSRREDEKAITRVESSTRLATRTSTSASEETPVNSTTTIHVDDVNENKARRKEKKKSSGLYALAVRVKDHNRYWQKDYSRSLPSSSSLTSAPLSPVMTPCSSASSSYQQKDEREGERVGVEREKDLIEWEWKREKEQRHMGMKEKKRRPLASFGSLSSMSGLSEYSTSGGGGRSTSDEGDSSFTSSSKKDSYGSGVGEEEERITLEGALDEILGRCLPGARVVR
ncbi:hypothetical protein AGABI1DRAFT_125949 [Agaricus bisporus var. burnettii JB137-S8]|uniref:F-box domain-containing protein n=1 Tax=Agaricus bisporus var. burnettii (strain JB137-S8 / ATCC MYA-4627 / FGSC 10392) TaxID=597362 RepID=K5Y1B9_AGABU|nr:uncharacterized protein AGABI1DRAFT_125949 [Agaricus bisporus var. burnettii JB137-S8]EKM81575.1 hypothetical protein AGABI1DRAFT_125949 [Agaricus bisporus var. burnettii JB137-S8]